MRWFSTFVIVYMLLALVWWAILLTTKNKQVYTLEKTLLELRTDPADQEKLQSLYSDYKKQSNMILGEGLVFGLSLLLGIWFIQRAYVREIESTEKQNNFLLSITHELKSPLTSINLGLETLQKREMPSELVQDIASSALVESNRLEKLISDLLLSTKIDHSYVFHYEKEVIQDLLSKVVQQFQRSRPAAVIELVIDPEPVVVQMDTDAVEKVISNLIENAFKYAPGKPISVTGVQEGNDFLIKVADQGMGIPKEFRGRVFEKFYRIGSEETRTTKGTGIGLYIASKIIEAHDGRIRVVENEGGGSVFEVRIPKSMSV